MEVNPYKSPSADCGLPAPQTVPSLTLPVTFDYDFKPEDMLSWCRFFYYNSPAGRRQRSQVILMSTLLYLIAAFILTLFIQSRVAAVAAFGVAIIASFTTPRWFDRRVKKAFKTHLDNAAFSGSYGPHQLTLSDVGIRETSPAGELFVKWPFVTGASREGD